jgi:hypothetical protein
MEDGRGFSTLGTYFARPYDFSSNPLIGDAFIPAPRLQVPFLAVVSRAKHSSRLRCLRPLASVTGHHPSPELAVCSSV